MHMQISENSIWRAARSFAINFGILSSTIGANSESAVALSIAPPVHIDGTADGIAHMAACVGSATIDGSMRAACFALAMWSERYMWRGIALLLNTRRANIFG